MINKTLRELKPKVGDVLSLNGGPWRYTVLGFDYPNYQLRVTESNFSDRQVAIDGHSQGWSFVKGTFLQLGVKNGDTVACCGEDEDLNNAINTLTALRDAKQEK